MVKSSMSPHESKNVALRLRLLANQQEYFARQFLEVHLYGVGRDNFMRNGQGKARERLSHKENPDRMVTYK